MKKFLSLLLAVMMILPALCLNASAAVRTFSVENLKIDNVENPAHIDNSAPCFSWNMVSDITGEKQTSYEIVLYKEDRTAGGDPVVFWDSGVVESEECLNIKYSGPALESYQNYLWYVTVTDNHGNKSTSESASFGTAAIEASPFENAKWIASPAEGAVVPVLMRTTFELTEDELCYADFYSTAIGVYEIYVNGVRVGRDFGKDTVYDELKPGWTDYRNTLFYYGYDITGLLKAGTNAVSAVVTQGWAHGRISGNVPGFTSLDFIGSIKITDKEGNVKEINTDTKWLTTREFAVSAADIYDGEVYNANLTSPEKASKPDFATDESWVKAKTVNEFKGDLTAFASQPITIRSGLDRIPDSITVYTYEAPKKVKKSYGEINVVSKPETADFTLEKGQTAVIDFGQNMVGVPQISLEAAKGTTVTFDFGEMLNDTGDVSLGNDGPKGSVYTANYRSAVSDAVYIASGQGTETYRPVFTFYGFRYMSVTASGNVAIKGIKAYVIGNDIKEVGTITTSDESVNQLFSNIIWGQRGNYLTVPTDCPQRDERLGWTGDAEIFAPTALYNSDANSFLRKFMLDLKDSQMEDGSYTDVAPRGIYGGSGNTAWADAGIIIPYTLYKMCADIQILDEMYDSMEKYMKFIENTNGLAGPNCAYGDWLAYEANDQKVKDLVSCVYYIYDCRTMAEISTILGKSDRTDYYTKRTAEVKKYFKDTFTTDEGMLKTGYDTQTCYLVSLKLHLFEGEGQQQKAAKILEKKIINNGNKLGTGFIGTGMINEVLSENGAGNLAYTLLLQRENPSWLFSVDNGATTIWERWNSYTKTDGFGDIGMNSFNHYSYGAVAEWMYGSMLGISPDENNPGFKHIIFKPDFDTRTDSEIPNNENKITSASGTCNSSYGAVSASWINNGGSFTYTIKVPANTDASVYIPVTNHIPVSVNGKQADALTTETDGVVYNGTKDGYAEFAVLSGTFTFTIDDSGIKDHTYSSSEITKGCLSGGYKYYTCSECGYSYYEETAEAAGHIDKNHDGWCDECNDELDSFHCPFLLPIKQFFVNLYEKLFGDNGFFTNLWNKVTK